ncbi:MAG: hypothetical protein R3327_01335 [Nitrosopumilaceae archaeon]|nr:hypothetical protein [Nitrosopumilaceae archaeon]
MDVKKETLEKILLNKNSFSNFISTDAKILDIKERNGESEIFVKVDASACIINTSFVHKFDKNLHIINFVSGNLKDSILTISLDKTWGFDGTEDTGTIVITNFLINDIPCVPDFLVGNDIIKFALDKGLVELEKKAKEFEKKNYSTKQNVESKKPDINQSSKYTDLEKDIEITPTMNKEPTSDVILANKIRTLAFDIANEKDAERQLELLEKIGKLRVLLEDNEEKSEFNKNTKLVTKTEKISNVQLTKSKNDENAHSKNQSFSMLNINSNEFKIEKYKPNWLEISGNIENPKRGNTVLLTITKPDSTTQSLKIFHTKDGYYQTKLFLDSKFPEGKYVVEATYNEKKDSSNFQVRVN